MDLILTEFDRLILEAAAAIQAATVDDLDLRSLDPALAAKGRAAEARAAVARHAAAHLERLIADLSGHLSNQSDVGMVTKDDTDVVGGN